MGDIVAIVPARGGSTRIPKKNLKEVDGDPLVGIAATHGREASHIDRTIVNSDDPDIRAVGEKYDTEVMDRPERYTQDNSVQEVDRLLQWCVEELESEGIDVDVIVLLYPTAPLRTIETVDEAVGMVVDGKYDSVLSLVESHDYLWEVGEESVEPTNYDPTKRGPTQKEEWNQWIENLAVYAVKRDVLMETGYRLGGKTGHVEMPEWRSVDIDTPTELHIARLLAENPPPE